MQRSLSRLSYWEKGLKDKNINKSEFLTKSTVEGLRVTLRSTIFLCRHLYNCGFQYVLTARLNQDIIEVIIEIKT